MLPLMLPLSLAHAQDDPATAAGTLPSETPTLAAPELYGLVQVW